MQRRPCLLKDCPLLLGVTVTQVTRTLGNSLFSDVNTGRQDVIGLYFSQEMDTPA